MNTTGTARFTRSLVPCTAAVAGAGLLLLTGCSAGGQSNPSTAPGRAVNGLGAHAPVGSAQFGAAAAVPSPGGPALAPAAASGGQAAAARLAPAGQSIVYTATMTVMVRDAMAAAGRASADAVAAGGYTAGEQAQAGSGRPRVSLTLKVPDPAYQTALAELGRLGRQTALRQQASDVTEQVADVSSRVASQQAEITQLRALLGRAGTVPDLLQVQDQLGDDETSLEALQAQQRALDHETTYATITAVLLGPAPTAARRAPARTGGFTGGLVAGWHGLRRATGWLLTVLGATAPFLGVVAVLGALAWLGRRRLAWLGRLGRRTGAAS